MTNVLVTVKMEVPIVALSILLPIGCHGARPPSLPWVTNPAGNYFTS